MPVGIRVRFHATRSYPARQQPDCNDHTGCDNDIRKLRHTGIGHNRHLRMVTTESYDSEMFLNQTQNHAYRDTYTAT